MSRPRRQRLLIRSTNWIGDAVMSLPAVHRLHELDPEAELTVLCPAKLHDLWAHNPALHDVLTFTAAPDLGALRDRAFDAAVLFPNSFRCAWEAWRAGIPTRIGYPGHHRRWLLTDVVPDPGDETAVYEELTVAGTKFRRKTFLRVRHQSHRYLDLIGHLGGNRTPLPPRIWIAHDELPPLTKFFHDDGRDFIAINAGAEYGPAKRWPAARFAEVACRVARETDHRWLLLGGPGDVSTARTIETALVAEQLPPKSVVNVAGQTTLRELFALLVSSKLLLTNDTGPMHIAAALGVPLVAVFGSTSPELTGPLGKRCTVVTERVACNPCFLRECPIDLRCMQAITVDRVTDAVLQML